MNIFWKKMKDILKFIIIVIIKNEINEILLKIFYVFEIFIF